MLKILQCRNNNKNIAMKNERLFYNETIFESFWVEYCIHV